MGKEMIFFNLYYKSIEFRKGKTNDINLHLS